MKKIILLAAVFLTFNALAEIKAVKLLYRGIGPFSTAKQFKVLYCSDLKCTQLVNPNFKERLKTSDLVMEKLAKDARRSLHIANMEIDHVEMYRTNFTKAFELLAEDFTHSDGSGSWEPKELFSFSKYYHNNQNAVILSQLNIVSNYMSGTGIDNNILIFNAKTSWGILITKLTYAE